MQVQRLFEIVYLLLYKKRVTASELAVRFEVSTRTIYRDIDTLSAAGIPIYTNKGKGGGIFLMDGFVLNRSLLSQEERHNILSALQGVQAVGSKQEDATLSRMRTFFKQVEPNWISLYLSDWSNRKQELFDDIKSSILEHHAITFAYYSSYAECKQRKVYPLQLWFKEHSWYLKAFCTEKQAVRTFKISRMRKMQVLKDSFSPMDVPTNQPHNTIQSYPNLIQLELQIDACMSYRVYDEFEDEDVTCCEDGNFLIHVSYPEDAWVYSMILSYGQYARLLAPQHAIQQLRAHITAMNTFYE